jgi:alpha-tubulin suppressor-like RCC1 family protein/ABC-type transport system involved in multi-copper enzyme maturation permease subunit
MNSLVRKEVRLILPAWAAALVLAVAPVWFVSVNDLVGWEHQGAAIACHAFALGAILLGLAPYGQECGLGTFSLLLAQPVARRRIWRVKIFVAAVGLVLALAALAVSYRIRIQQLPSREVVWHVLLICGLFALAAFAGGLWTTILFRQVSTALWFTMLVPPAILVSTSKLWDRGSENLALKAIGGVLVVYSIAGLYLARRLWLGAQDTQWTGGTLSFPARPGFGARTRSSAVRAPGRRFGALFWKEFGLHQVSLFLGGSMLLLHFMVVLIRRMDHDPGEDRSALFVLLDFWWVLWLGFPFLVGSSAVAEERKLGTLAGQLCLPVARRAQFAVKLMVALVLGTVLGGVMPCVAEGIGGWGVVPGSLVSAEGHGFWQPMAVTCLVAAGTTLISFYASTLVRNLSQALGAAVVVGFTLSGIGTWAMDGAADGHYPLPWGMPLIGCIGLPVTLAVLFWLALKNYSHPQVDWQLWRRNLITVFAALFLACTAAAAVYHRPWEWMMTLEPAHGPARLSGSVRPMICSAAGFKLFVLLPDGRLWSAGDYELKTFGDYEVEDQMTQKRHRETVRIPVPVDGSFLGGSWVSLASSYDRVFGVGTDGSLWKVFSIDRTIPWWNGTNLSANPKPERDGTESDWEIVAGGQSHFLALKKDGTLWGWGDNHYGQLGSAAREFANRPVRIGEDADWKAIFAAAAVSIGVKRDGSVWKWGGLGFGPNGWAGWKGGPHPRPENWNLDGTGWVALAGEPGFDLALRRDGTLWASGNLPRNLFGIPCEREFISNFRRIGRDSDWADVTSRFRRLVGIEKDGTLLECDMEAGSMFWGRNLLKPSRYSDWTAIGADGWYESVALAADGTLCAWGDPRGQQGLLCPSRKPLWSLNIFAKSDGAGPVVPGAR